MSVSSRVQTTMRMDVYTLRLQAEVRLDECAWWKWRKRRRLRTTVRTLRRTERDMLLG